MNHLIKFTLPCLIFILFSSCYNKAAAQPSAINKAFDSVKAVKEIADQNKIFSDALGKSDSIQAASIYSTDTRILNQGSPSTIGRAAVVSFYGDMIRNGITRFSYATTGAWGTDNNLIMEEGTLSFAFSNGNIAAKGRYLLVWKREGGVLKIFRDTFSSDGKISN